MIVTIDKLSKEWVGVNGRYYMARAVDVTGKLEISRMLVSFQELPKFIKEVEECHKEQCTEVVFHNGSWTKTRDEIFSQEKAGHE
jgi:hypothetical protein